MGGVGRSTAHWTTSGGGRARGEMMMGGASDGSVGRRDQMAHPPISGREGEATGDGCVLSAGGGGGGGSGWDMESCFGRGEDGQ